LTARFTDCSLAPQSAVAVAAILLLACTPAPQAPEPPPAVQWPGATPPDLNVLLNPASSQWLYRADAGVSSACFGAPESECQLTIVCEAPSGRLSLSFEHELAPDQATVLRIFTATTTLDLPAQSFNEGLPSVNVELAETAAERQPLIEALSPAQERFGVEVQGEITVFPWDQSLAHVLAACG
jgi:hypothetical protein